MTHPDIEAAALERLDAAIRDYAAATNDGEGPVTHWVLVTGFLTNDDGTDQGPRWTVAPGGQQSYVSAGLLHAALHPEWEEAP